MQLQCLHREKCGGESLVCCRLVTDEGAGKALSCQYSSVSWLQPTEELLHRNGLETDCLVLLWHFGRISSIA